MRYLLFFLSLFFSEVYAQSFSSSELENFLKMNISDAQDYIEAKGYRFVSGKIDDDFFKDDNVLRFDAIKNKAIRIDLVYNKSDVLPSAVFYYCLKEDFAQKKKLYQAKGFRLTSHTADKQLSKYFFDKKGSIFFLAFTTFSNSYDGTTGYLVQLLRK